MDTLQRSTPARLHHIKVVTGNVPAMTGFYERMLDMKVLDAKDGCSVMAGAARAMLICADQPGAAPYYAYAVADKEQLNALKERLVSRSVSVQAVDDPLLEGGAVMLSDPQGRRIVFGVGREARSFEGAPARLQHTVFQTTRLEEVVRFYEEQVGFTISDEVVDADGRLMVAFMRSDDEHHTLAFFRGSKDEWDHHCYETNEWNDIRDWGDRFAAAEIPIFFGPGRHGPGNNLFFMVTDPDGNRLEFSAELARVAADAPPGVWPQSERTLNSWGRAWMRT